MRLAFCLSAVVCCVAALPTDVSFQAFEELDLSKVTPKNIYLEPVNHGKSRGLPQSRIIGGSALVPNSVPYQVALFIDGRSFCGGSLISTTRVLTAAHCTIRASYMIVVLGAHDIYYYEANKVYITSTSVTNHAQYEVGGFSANDIAVIFLPKAAPLSANIQIVPLAPASSGTLAGSRAFLSGWGSTSGKYDSAPSKLYGVNLDVISNDACKYFYGSNILPTTICTSGVGSVGACYGDSGGPLVIHGVGQVGITSFGTRGCEAGTPTAFTRISSYRSWIKGVAGV